MSAEPKVAARSKMPKRKMTRSNVDALNVDVPGIGRFALQAVGSTMRSHGYMCHFQPEGADEPLGWGLPFVMSIDQGFRIVWKTEIERARHNNLRTREPFPDAAIAAATRILDELPQRDETGLMFDVMDNIRDELQAHEHLAKTAAESRGHFLRAMAKAASPEKKEGIARRIAEIDAKIAYLVRRERDRNPQLRAAEEAIREWSSRGSETRHRPLMDLLDEAFGRSVPSPSIRGA